MRTVVGGMVGVVGIRVVGIGVGGLVLVAADDVLDLVDYVRHGGCCRWCRCRRCRRINLREFVGLDWIGLEWIEIEISLISQ
jgi:hypothetical protein